MPKLRSKITNRPRGAPLWKLSLVIPAEAEAAVVEWLGGVFAHPVSSFTASETRRATVTVWCSKKPGWTPRRRAELRAGLEQIGRYGLHVRPARVSLSRVRPEHWAQSWKRHFPPIEIRPALLIRPSWSRRRPRPGQAVLVLDPGLSFGTGKHPTTAFCLRQLAAHRPASSQEAAGPQPSFLDIGTGSGILAIAAAKLGYAPVEAHDIDPEAVRIARANARRNGVSRRIAFLQRDLARLPLRPRRQFDVVCANLTSDLLIRERQRIVSRLKPGGLLVLAGILATEFPAVRRAYEVRRLSLVTSRVQREWCSGSFILKNF